MSHNWAEQFAKPFWMPESADPFGTWGFWSPSGNLVACAGSPFAVLVVRDGSGVPINVTPYESGGITPGFRKHPSGKAVEKIFDRSQTIQAIGSVDLKRLRDAVGEAAQKPEAIQETCDECNGTCEVECHHCGHDMECEECNGTGVTERFPDVDDVIVKIDKGFYNTIYLAPLVAMLPAEGRVRLSVRENGAGYQMNIDGDGWSIVAMSYIPTLEEDVGATEIVLDTEAVVA